MPWVSGSVNSRYTRTVAALILSMLLGVAAAGPANAVETEIGAVVCGTGTPGAAIAITQPSNDSIVNQATTTFRGTINNTSQIEIEIDGNYVSTVAVGSNQTVFNTDISLSEGTHTIKLTANDICGGLDASDSVVITYTPVVNAPSNGSSTPTEVDGQSNVNTLSGFDINDGGERPFMQQIQELPVIGSAVSVVADFTKAIGLSGTIESTNVIAGLARVGLTVAALTSVVMASTLAPLAAQSIPGISEAFNIKSHRSMLYLGWLIRGVGVVTMTIVYFL